MKKIVLSMALSLVLTFVAASAMAQSLSIHPTGSLGGHAVNTPVHSPNGPRYCRPCLYYGGDWPVDDANWVAWANTDGGGFGGPVFLYSGFRVPPGKTWTVTGLFSNNAFVGIDHFTPSTPEWSITKGMKNGVAGHTVKKGESKGSAKVTGRSCCSGIGEYTVSVKLKNAVVLNSGSYVEGVTPPCDSTKDSACSGALFYETDSYNPNNTNNRGANNFGPKPAKGNNFQNSSVFGLNYQQVNGDYCTASGYQAYACNFLSAGVVGTQQ